MKNKKLRLLVLFIIASCLLFSACNIAPSVYSVTGIENFRKEDSNLSLNQCLLPSEFFLKLYKYEEADYYYRDKYTPVVMVPSCEQSFVRLRYDEENYQVAKEACLEEMRLSEQNIFEYNGFTFIENIALHYGSDVMKDGVNTKYPYYFNMFVYNDQTQELIFMGFYGGTLYQEESSIALTDWGAFLDKYYSDFYDFGGQGDGSVVSSIETDDPET